MTDKTTVTQADSDAADLFELHWYADFTAEQIGALKQAFAAHRLAHQPAPDAVPVDWQREHPVRGWISCDADAIDHYRSQGQNVRALYAHPPSTQPTAAEVERVERELDRQMDQQADDTTPSSIQRDKGLIWLEGWFDIPAAIAALTTPTEDARHD